MGGMYGPIGQILHFMRKLQCFAGKVNGRFWFLCVCFCMCFCTTFTKWPANVSEAVGGGYLVPLGPFIADKQKKIYQILEYLFSCRVWEVVCFMCMGQFHMLK